METSCDFLVYLLVVNSLEKTDVESCFSLHVLSVCVFWPSWRNSLVSGQKGLRNTDINVWKIAMNFEKAGIIFAYLPY